MRLKAIACDVFYREMCYLAAVSPNQVDVEFLPKGLHDIGCALMRERLQAAVNRVDADKYEAIAMVYALCNNGSAGLAAGAVPLVIPRAHDCISLFMGGRRRYEEYFNANPGVYFKTSGWIERGGVDGELRQLSIGRLCGLDMSYEEMVEKYGEDNAKYLYEQLGDQTRHYSKLAYIEMGIEPDNRFEEQTRREAEERGWAFEKIRGDLSMLRRLVDGKWDGDEFLTVPPGSSVMADYGGQIIQAEPSP